MATDALSTTLFALADPTRRAILARLASGDAPVKELAAPYEMSQAAVSKHLKVLESAGLISRRKEAQWRPCRLEAAPLQTVAEWVEEYRRFWDRSFEALKVYVKTLQPQAAPFQGQTARSPKAENAPMTINIDAGSTVDPVITMTPYTRRTARDRVGSVHRPEARGEVVRRQGFRQPGLRDGCAPWRSLAPRHAHARWRRAAPALHLR